MTAEQYADSRPDLGENWNRATSQQWRDENPGYESIVDYIRSFPTFFAYLSSEAYADGVTFTAPTAAVVTTAPAVTNSVSPVAVTAAEFAATNPDLAQNWTRAHSAQWIAANPGSAAVAAQIAAYPSFNAYLVAAHGGPFSGAPIADPVSAGTPQTTTPAVTTTPRPITLPVVPLTLPGAPSVPLTMPGAPTMPATISPFFDPTHRKIGSDAMGRPVSILVDEGGDVIQWTDAGGGVATDKRNLGAADRSAAQIAASLAVQMGTPGGAVITGGAGEPGGTAAPSGGTDSKLLLVGLAAALAWAFSRSRS